MSIWIWLGIGIIIVFIALLIIIWLLPEDKIESSPILRTIKNCCKRFVTGKDDDDKYF